MTRASDRSGLDVNVRLRYLEDDADRSDERHKEADVKFDKLVVSVNEQVDAFRSGQVANQKVLISILVALVVAAFMLAANLALVGT